jgi:hypothetical protein
MFPFIFTATDTNLCSVNVSYLRTSVRQLSASPEDALRTIISVHGQILLVHILILNVLVFEPIFGKVVLCKVKAPPLWGSHRSQFLDMYDKIGPIH